MAAKKKKTQAKKPKKATKLVKKPVVKAKPALKKKAAPKKAVSKRKGTPRNPPMHAKVKHPELSDDETPRDEVFEVFKAYDRDGSGSIDAGELSRLLEALGQPVSEEDLQIALSVVDVNSSGRISWPEFQSWWSNR